MTKLIIIAFVIILAVLGVLFLGGIGGANASCLTKDEAQCKKNILCKANFQYGLTCGEEGCSEGQKFVSCTSRL